MTRLLITAALSTALCAGAATGQSKRDPDVQKTLQRAYPGSQSQVVGTEQINGVKVFNVNVADKAGTGTSTAQITEHGDFLMYGAPQRSPALTKLITDSVGQMFQSQPSDIQLYRTTSYLIDIPVQAEGKGNQVYQMRLDAVGRVLDIADADEVKAAQKAAGKQELKDEKVAKQLEQVARDRFVGKEAELQRISQSNVKGFYEADFKGAAVTLNDQGQILQIREDVTGKELPLPVRQTLDQLVKSSIRGQRIEEEYFQFTQQSATGNAVTVKMRPDGDIIDVVNSQAQQEEQAVVAKDKQKAGTATPKKAN